MPTVLRPVSAANPRPLLADPDTIRRAVEGNREALVGWTRRTNAAPDGDEWALQAICDALIAQKGEPTRAARLLEMVHRWKCDDFLLHHLETVKKNYPIALDLRVLEWVIKTGLRFPAQLADLIVYYDFEFQLRQGRVSKLNTKQASAIVQGEHGVKCTVFAERVTANRTRGLEVNPMPQRARAYS